MYIDIRCSVHDKFQSNTDSPIHPLVVVWIIHRNLSRTNCLTEAGLPLLLNGFPCAELPLGRISQIAVQRTDRVQILDAMRTTVDIRTSVLIPPFGPSRGPASSPCRSPLCSRMDCCYERCDDANNVTSIAIRS